MSRKIEIPSGHPGGIATFIECPEMFCPGCGNKGLWDDQMDDYYQGSGYWCLKCNSISHIGTMEIKEPFWVARLEHLKVKVETRDT